VTVGVVKRNGSYYPEHKNNSEEIARAHNGEDVVPKDVQLLEGDRKKNYSRCVESGGNSFSNTGKKVSDTGVYHL